MPSRKMIWRERVVPIRHRDWRGRVTAVSTWSTTSAVEPPHVAAKPERVTKARLAWTTSPLFPAAEIPSLSAGGTDDEIKAARVSISRAVSLRLSRTAHRELPLDANRSNNTASIASLCQREHSCRLRPSQSVVEVSKPWVPRFWCPRQDRVDWNTGNCQHGHPNDSETVVPQIQQNDSLWGCDLA